MMLLGSIIPAAHCSITISTVTAYAEALGRLKIIKIVRKGDTAMKRWSVGNVQQRMKPSYEST
jgi:hypothetical protein